MKNKLTLIGKDNIGNKYYYCKKTDKRIVKYLTKKNDPTTISPLWYMWLHNKSIDVLERSFSWEKERNYNNTNDRSMFAPNSSINKRLHNNSIYSFWNSNGDNDL